MEEQNNLIETTATNVVVSTASEKPKRKSKKEKEKPILVIQDTEDIDVQNTDGLKYLQTIQANSVDLILTDPPYIISKDSGMNEHYNNVKFNEENNIEYVKSEEEWETYKTENAIDDDINKEKYMKYGSIYGKKYCVKTDYGAWDSDFTMEALDTFIGEY